MDLFFEFVVLPTPGVESEMAGRGRDDGVILDSVLRFSGCIPVLVCISERVGDGCMCTAAVTVIAAAVET